MKSRMSRTAVAILISSIAGAACSQSEPANAEATAAAAGGDAAPAVKTVATPGDACGWIAAAEVEQIIGKLDGPPRAAGKDCIYPLAEKSEAFTRMVEFRRKMRSIDNIKTQERDDSDLDSLVRLTVDPSADSIIGDIATAAVGKIFARELGQRPSEAAKKAAPPAGWDAESGLPYTWIGRAGHISISVYSPPEITKEKKIELASRVRDRIGDLPFAADNTYQIPTFAADRNPCELLTRAEAEAVLGPLVVDPYRAIEDTPHAYAKGKACAYFTPGHRALVITPEWTDGAMTFKLSTGIGGLIGAVAPIEKTKIEGPWDQGRVDGTTGALMFLKGDRSLRVDYLTSATDRDGALKIAAQAVERLSQ